MKYSSKLDRDNGICIIQVTGTFHRPFDSDELKNFAVKYSIEHSCRLFLIVLTQAEVVGGTMHSFAAANPKGTVAENLRKIKTAFVRQKLEEDDRFYENVAVNRGFHLRAFDTVEKAVEWLKQP